jgi:ATP-dependent Clp protease adaptor protein ClpS
VSSEPSLPETSVTAEPETDEATRTRRLPPYNVILENDDHHSFEFVVMVLCKALGYSVEKSFQLTDEAHTSGCAVVWTGAKEVAELKAEQIQTFHELRERDNRDLGPLGCRIEPAPGA